MNKKLNKFAIRFRLRLKSRIFFTLTIFFCFIFIILLFVVVKSPIEERVETTLEPNIVFLDNITVDYLIDNDTYIKLKAKTALYRIKSYNIELMNMEFIYKKDNTSMIIFSDNASYEKERIIIARENLNGRMNDINFYGKPFSKLRYDYIEDKGSIQNGIKAIQNDNNIEAGSVYFGSQADGDILFSDDVTVNYVVSDNKKEKKD